MRILQVCTSRDQLRRGAERFCLNLSKSLALADHDVTLVTGDRNAPILNRLIHNHLIIPEIGNLIGRKLLFDYFNPRAVHSFRHIVDKLKPDIVHFHSFYGLSSSLAKVAKLRCPVFVTLHDSWLAFADGGILVPRLGLSNSYLKVPHGYAHRLINKYLLKDTTLISPSLWMKHFFEDANFQTPTHIPNGIETTNSSTTYQNTIIWVGTLTTFKGLPSVIGTIANISSTFGWRFIVVGDGPHRANLELLYPHVDFVGYQDPSPYYKEASILIVSSIGYENFPTVILEGMQHGLCIVGHNLGGIAELIRHNETGILYNSVDSLAENLQLLLGNHKQIRQLGSSAKNVFSRKYDWDICFNRYLNLYREMISNSYINNN